MSLFNSSRSTQENTVNNNLTDQRVAASDSGIAAGSGATVTINDLSADVIKQQADSNLELSRAALSGNAISTVAALKANTDVSSYAIGSNERTVGAALDFAASQGSGARDLAVKAIAGAQKSQEAGNDLASSLSTLLADKLHDNNRNDNEKLIGDAIKNITTAAAVVGAVVLVFKLLSSK